MHGNTVGEPSVTTGHPSRRLVAATVAGALLVAIATETALPATVGLALLAAAAIALGPDVAIGGVAGLLVHDLVWGAVGYWTATDAAWVVATTATLLWLVPHYRRWTPPVRPAWWVGLATVTAGVVGMASAGLVAFLVGGQRFAVAALDALPAAVVLVAVVGTAALTGRATRRGTTAGATVETDGGPTGTASPSSDWRLLVLVLAVGLAWLAAAASLDVLAHDLSLFPTEPAVRRYATRIVGTGSSLRRAGRAVFVGLYRYGDLAVVLVSAVAGVTLGALHRQKRSGGER